MQKIANTIQITLTTNECRNCGSIADSWVKNPGKDTKVEETKQTEMSQGKGSIIKFMQNNRKQATYIHNKNRHAAKFAQQFHQRKT